MKSYYICNLRGLGFVSLENADKVSDIIEKNRINISYLSHFNSKVVIEKTDEINQSINAVLKNVGELQGEVAQQKRHIKNTIEKHNTDINNFLLSAGYKYHVAIKSVENEQYKLKLYHNDYIDSIPGDETHLSYDYYKTAGDLYIELHESFKAFLPEYNDDFLIRDNINKYIPMFGKNNENDLKLSIYFANSICEAYSRILLCVDEKSLKNEEVQYTKDGREIKDLEEITKKAIFYGCCSTKWANDIVNNEVYYRNLGCAYERYERLFGKLGDYHKEIIKNYQKAFELIVDNKVLSYRVQSVYHTLISYLRKYLESKLNISNVFKDNNPDVSLNALTNAIANENCLTSEDAKYLKLLYDVSCFAKKDNPRHRLQFSVNGLSLAIIAYLKLKKDSIIEQVCTYTWLLCVAYIQLHYGTVNYLLIRSYNLC